MTIIDQIVSICETSDETIFSSKDIKELLFINYNYNTNAYINLSDYCYNRINKGIDFKNHLFIYLERGKYEYIGKNDCYSGDIKWKAIDKTKEICVGEWKNGTYRLFEEVFTSKED